MATQCEGSLSADTCGAVIRADLNIASWHSACFFLLLPSPL